MKKRVRNLIIGLVIILIVILSSVLFWDFEDETKLEEEICVPKTCLELGQDCGEWNDGCGSIINCGKC